MARTKQTARVSTGGKAARKGKSNGSNKACHPAEVVVESDVSYDSCFYAHYFGSGAASANPADFYSTCSLSKVKHLDQDEYWLAVNFNSKYDGPGMKEHKRPTLNLVVALDVSGSMQSTFVGDKESMAKIDVAKQNITNLISQLNEDDSFGLLVFDDSSEVLVPLTKLKAMDMEALHNTVRNIAIRGGTTVTQALEAATKMFDNAEEGPKISNRIFFMTDMETGQVDGQSFTEVVKKNSDDSKWTTVVGVGLDLTSNIIESVSRTPGCNYANVRSCANFKEILEEEFGFLVTPVAFNISIDLMSSQYVIERGFGSPEVSGMKQGDVIKICTEFPSSTNEKNERRGGGLIFKLRKIKEGDSVIKISIKHDNLQGIQETEEQELKFEEIDNASCIRKMLFLMRYTDTINKYIAGRNARQQDKKRASEFDEAARVELQAFSEWMKSEKDILKDESLQQEINQIELFVQLETKKDDAKKEEPDKKDDAEMDTDSMDKNSNKRKTRSDTKTKTSKKAKN